MAGLTAKEMREMCEKWLEERKNHFSPGDRHVKSMLKDLIGQFSRMEGIESQHDSPGAKAAVNAIQSNKRDAGPGGTQYDPRPMEPRGVENQPKSFDDARKAFAEAHDKFMQQVGATNKEPGSVNE